MTWLGISPIDGVVLRPIGSISRCVFRIIVFHKSRINIGTSMPSRMFTNSSSFIIPSIIHIPVLPFFDIPAHMCTFIECLGPERIYIQSCILLGTQETIFICVYFVLY